MNVKCADLSIQLCLGGKKKKKKKENELTGSIRTEEPAGEGTPLNSDVL